VPGTTAQVAAYYREIRPALRMTREAADTLFFLAAPPPPWLGKARRRGALDLLGRLPFRLATLGVASTALALLPPWARRLYGGLGLPVTDLSATVAARGLRLALNAVPHRVYEGPIYRAAMARAAAADSG